MRDPRILYVGPLMHGGTCLQRMWALQDLQYSVVSVDTGVSAQLSYLSKLGYKVWRKLFVNSAIARINQKIIDATIAFQPHIIWIDKGLTITSDTLYFIKQQKPEIVLISFSPDDMMNPDNQSEYYLDCLPIYDYHVTTKSYNVDELKALGAKRIVMINNSYCRRSHKPITLSESQRVNRGGPVGFIGFWEKERAAYMTFLAEHNVPVRIWGPWNRRAISHPNLRIEGSVAWGNDYAATICAFDINLGFLRKVNRDLQTTRSIEIPACGGFMLSERTNELLSLFQEGKEAEFFDSEEELLDKTIYYLRHDQRRREIAASGYQRCLKSGYSYTERLAAVMKIILDERRI